jgi:hypothetical protein
MNNIYYLIWTDAINSYKKHHPNKTNWKIILLVYMSWIHALNCWIILIWLKYFNILTISLININIFPSKMLNSFLAFVIAFAFPFIFINYFLIFYKNRYAKIIYNCNNKKIRYAPIYSILIACAALLSAFIYGAL